MAEFTGLSATSSLTRWGRVAVLGLAICLMILLGTAAWLKPNPDGFGTHRGLGLPRCTVVELWGMRCPSCGMTTAWSHVVRGNLVQSLKANVGGAALGVLSVLATPWLIVSGIRGRWWLVQPNEWTLLVMFSATFAITLVDWSFRLRGW